MENISANIKDNNSYIESLFENAVDFTERKFSICGTDAVLYSLDGLVNKQNISISIMNPIMKSEILELTGYEKMNFIEKEVLGAVDQVRITKISEIIERLMAGFAILLIDECDFGLAFGVQGFEKRGITEPDNEKMQRGAKDGFVESHQTNISLIRRRMRNTELKFERMYVGSKSKTPVILCYLNKVASKDLLKSIKSQINACNLETLMAAGYLSGYLKRSGIFGNVGVTERPDTVCGKIMEGRVVIIVDGTPTALIVPNLFVENFQCLDDYANRPFYATFTRWVRYISFFVAFILPGLYSAIVVHRPELLPDILLMKIGQEESKTPFTVIWELLLLNLLYEIMHEASLRAPKVLSQSVSIVGALVIGDTAVKSGLIGAPSLMIIASSAIAGYAIPKLYEQMSVLRLVYIIVGGLLGPWGIVAATVLLIFSLCSEKTFGVPVTTPVTPFGISGMRDVLIRAPWKKLSQKTIDVEELPGTEGGIKP